MSFGKFACLWRARQLLLAESDSLVARFDPIREKKQGAKPIDIAEYRAAAKDFAETAHEANLLIQLL